MPPPQLVGPSQGDAYLRLKMKDQIAALEMVAADPALRKLRKVGCVPSRKRIIVALRKSKRQSQLVRGSSLVGMAPRKRVP